MGEANAVRVTRGGGDLAAYRITRGGAYRVTYTEAFPVPAAITQILRVRGMIYDPLANDLFFVTSLPDEPPEGAAFTRGDGVYWAYPGGEWVKLPLKFSDAAVEDMLSMGGGVITAACLLIDRLTARIQPDGYITGGNAGGQSLSFPSLADMLAFYRGLKKDLLDEEARLNAGSFIITPRPPVGGVYEDREAWG